MTGTLNASPIHHKPIYKCRTLKFSSISLSHKKAKELKEKNTLKEIEKFTKNKKIFHRLLTLMSLQFYIQDVHVALFYAMKANGDKGCQAPEMIKVALQVSQLLHYIPSHSCNLNMQKISNVAYHIMRHMRTMTIWLLDAIKPDTTHQV